jgi:hypothetical protein
MLLCFYAKLRTSQTIRQTSTKVPISPYPNIVTSSEARLGFIIPTNHIAPPHSQCMSHLEHNRQKFVR